MRECESVHIRQNEKGMLSAKDRMYTKQTDSSSLSRFQSLNLPQEKEMILTAESTCFFEG
jgi:hypothetical protein